MPLASFYFAYFAYAGIGMAFLPLYFASRGLQAGEIAFLVALPYIARTFAPAAWAGSPTRPARGGNRRLLLLPAPSGSLCFLRLAAWRASPDRCRDSAAVLRRRATGRGDHLASLAGRGRYGPIRVWGSVGFIFATVGGGAWLDYWPATTLPPLLVALSLVALVVAIALPSSPPRMRLVGGAAASAAVSARCSPPASACQRRMARFIRSSRFISSAKGTAASPSAASGRSACSPRSSSSSPCRRCSAATRCRRSCSRASPAPSCASSPSAGCRRASGFLIPAQLLHAATFGAFHAASVAAVHRLFPESAQARGQTLFSSLSYGAGGAAGALVAGWAWQADGPAVAFSASAAIAGAGACFACRVRRFGL